MRLILVLFAVAATGALAADAFACSCAARPDAERFAAAEGAFIGTLVERRDLGDPNRVSRSSGDPYVNVYRVEESFKGGFSGTVEIKTVASSATCGLDWPVGTRSALYPRKANGGWTAGSCDEGRVEGMRAAAAAAQPPLVKRAKTKSRRAVRCAPRKAKAKRRAAARRRSRRT
jgi:hypothetical protein